LAVIAGELRTVNLADGARGRQRQNYNDQDGRDGPGKLDGGTAVHLWRLCRVIVGRPSSVTNHCVKKQATNNHEDTQADQQYQHRGLVYELRRRSDRSKNVLHGSNLVRALCEYRSGQSCCE
jgi:hypothetical protein